MGIEGSGDSQEAAMRKDLLTEVRRSFTFTDLPREK
jgi:hypothetical protein